MEATVRNQGQILEGFEEAPSVKSHRLIMIGEGSDGTGKTRFGLTAPGPLAFLNTDVGMEGVIEDFSEQKKVFVSNYLHEYLNLKVTPDLDGNTVRDMYMPLWTKILANFDTAVKSPIVRTIVADTFTTMWEIVKYARLGRQVLPLEAAYKYGPVNTEYMQLVQRVYNSDKNMILLHRLKDEYVKNESTGEKILDGCKKTPYEVQVRVRFHNDGSNYRLEITKCRQNGIITGLELEGAECDFPHLAQLVFPDTELKDWE